MEDKVGEEEEKEWKAKVKRFQRRICAPLNFVGSEEEEEGFRGNGKGVY